MRIENLKCVYIGLKRVADITLVLAVFRIIEEEIGLRSIVSSIVGG